MKKFLLDALIFALFLLTMSFHFLPRMFHEIFGLMLAAAVVVHLNFNRSWIFGLTRGNWTARRFFSTLINFLLLVDLILIVVTGICISNYIFGGVIPLDLRRNMTIHQLHVALPYVMIILVGLHVGLHRQFILSKILRQKNIPRGVEYLTLIILIGAGIYGSFLNRVGDRILT